MPKIIGQKISDIDSYFGGKGASGTYQQIINCIRPHRALVIPFLGNCSVARNIKAAAITIGVDMSSCVVDAWQKMNFDWINVEQNCSIKHLPYIVGDLSADFSVGTRFLTKRSDIVVYMDPPYPMDSRKSQRNQYEHEMTDKQHIELLVLANTLNCDVLISTYENPLYDEYLKGWNKISWTAMTRQGPAIETLYMNYHDIDQLHDYSYLGENYRERERIAKKVKRHVKKMQSLPKLEREAILSALLSVDNHQK